MTAVDAHEPNYIQGHHSSVLASHGARTAADSCGYLLERLVPGMSILDLRCGPGSITLDLALVVGTSGRGVGERRGTRDPARRFGQLELHGRRDRRPVGTEPGRAGPAFRLRRAGGGPGTLRSGDRRDGHRLGGVVGGSRRLVLPRQRRTHRASAVTRAHAMEPHPRGWGSEAYATGYASESTGPTAATSSSGTVSGMIAAIVR